MFAIAASELKCKQLLQSFIWFPRRPHRSPPEHHLRGRDELVVGGSSAQSVRQAPSRLSPQDLRRPLKQRPVTRVGPHKVAG